MMIWRSSLKGLLGGGGGVDLRPNRAQTKNASLELLLVLFGLNARVDPRMRIDALYGCMGWGLGWGLGWDGTATRVRVRVCGV
jgi:hypothetical protein